MRFGCAALALAVLCGCGSPPPPKAAPERAFHLEPLTDLVALPHLGWLVHARPRALYAVPAMALGLEELVGSARMAAFSRAHGGVDPRSLHELVFAQLESNPGHEPGELWLGRGYVPAAALEQAELTAIPYVRQHAREPGGLIRIEGRAEHEPIDVLVFGHHGAAWARGAPLAAKTARAFAEQRLKKVRPALTMRPLAELDAALGAADLRVFGARPDRAFARDDLFSHFEAVGAAVVPSEREGELWLTLRLIAVGSFEGREHELEERVRARLARIDGSRLGRLFGIAAAPAWTFSTRPRVLRAERTVRGAAFLHGLHLATGADTAELFAAP